MSRLSHSKSKRSVLDDAAYEQSLNYVSEKGRRLAGRIIARQSRKDVPVAQASTLGSSDCSNQVPISGPLSQLASNISGGGPDESTTVVLHDYVSVFAPLKYTAPGTVPQLEQNIESRSLAPLTPSQLLIKFIGYIPIRWLETIVKAVGQEYYRQSALTSKPQKQRLPATRQPLFAGEGLDEEGLKMPEDSDEANEEEIQAILGLDSGENQRSRELRRKSNAIAELDEKRLMVATLNGTTPLQGTTPSSAGYMTSTVRSIPSTATPLSLLDTFLSGKQQEASVRAADTYGAIKAEQARVFEQFRQEQEAINTAVSHIASINQNAMDTNTDPLAAEREAKVQHMALMAETKERFRVATTMAIIAQLVHQRGNEAKAYLVLLRLFEAIAESGIAEEGRWRDDVGAMDASYAATRRAEQEEERRFLAHQNKMALSVRDLLQRGDKTRDASFIAKRSHIPSSSSALAAKWKLRYEQRKEAVIKTVIRDVLLPFLTGKDHGALQIEPSVSHGELSSLELLKSSSLHMLFDMYPSQSDGRALTATALAMVASANAMYQMQLASSASNLLHLGMLVDAEEGTGPVFLTESGDEVRVPWWYIPRWEIERKQESCLKRWQQFRPTQAGTKADTEASNNVADVSKQKEDFMDPNADLLPTAADIFKALYYSHKPSTSSEAVSLASLSSSIGGEGFNNEDWLSALMLCQNWANTVDDKENYQDTIPSNKFPPVRPFLSFPFHVTVQLSEPAKVTLKEVLVPFVEGFWAQVATTTAADILAGKDQRDELAMEAARAAAATDSTSNSFFGPFVSGNSPTKFDNSVEGTMNLTGTNLDLSASPTASAMPSSRKGKQNAKELEEKRKRATAAKEASRIADAAKLQEQSIARHEAFLEQHQSERNKEVARLTRIQNAAKEQTQEKEKKTTLLNDPIAKARERLQQQLDAASRMYKQNESVAPKALPSRPEPAGEEGADRTEDFHFVINKAKRPLDQNALAAKFLGGGISSGAVTSESPKNRGGGVASNDGSTVGFSFTPTVTHPQSPRGGYHQHPFVSNPYLAEALSQLDAEASRTHSVDEVEFSRQKKMAHEKASERYHQHVMEKIVNNRMNFKLDTRRKIKNKEKDDAEELALAQ